MLLGKIQLFSDLLLGLTPEDRTNALAEPLQSRQPSWVSGEVYGGSEG
eukprot:CAMPEP_0197537314 /NCGR_PEP_ID=MMETSP1318-20131121/56503_1 /TAXON_ID=552666 /ORGANISM="Partenskyella glossopodia, Strain RCC365" /LENGTH=47 /DNA_ID= /DNA_START= /DNA_END= /DNA_ORIENTATION=